MRIGIRRQIVASVALFALVGGSAAASVAASEGPHAWSVQPSEAVSQPAVEGPIPEGTGIRTGKPYRTSLVTMDDGWLEEEFFFSGIARSEPAGGSEAEYKSRILVRRPADAQEFNGTVVIDWTNVTVPDDTDVAWLPTHRTVMERGFVYVAVAAQLLAIEASPLALKQWDPVRYGSLSHPGDGFSFDIFSQASEAVLDPKVLGDLRPLLERRIAFGASQSAGRIRTYINGWQETHGVFDAFVPAVSSPSGVRRDLVPILWFNSSSEIGGSEVAEDSDLFRLWEVAGPAHTTNEYSTYENMTYVYSHSNGLSGNPYDEEATGGWGYQLTPGTCNARNYYTIGPVASAALVTIDDWLRSGIAPDPAPRAARADGARLHDEHGNVVGGIRSPLVDVPVATYYGGAASTMTPCGQVGGRLPLTGTTEVFSADELAELYPTLDDYLTEFEAAVDAALEAGFLLPEGASDLLRRAHEYGLPGRPA